MSWPTGFPIVAAVGAVIGTLGVGTYSTNAHIDDVNRRIDGVNTAMGARLDATPGRHPRVEGACH